MNCYMEKNDKIEYTEYITEAINNSINYSEYIEEISNPIDYSEYIAEAMVPDHVRIAENRDKIIDDLLYGEG